MYALGPTCTTGQITINESKSIITCQLLYLELMAIFTTPAKWSKNWRRKRLVIKDHITSMEKLS